MGVSISELSLAFNLSYLSGTTRILKKGIISKQVLRTLRGDGLSGSLGLRINVELRKVKVMISFLGLTESVIEAIRIGGPELL